MEHETGQEWGARVRDGNMRQSRDWSIGQCRGDESMRQGRTGEQRSGQRWRGRGRDGSMRQGWDGEHTCSQYDIISVSPTLQLLSSALTNLISSSLPHYCLSCFLALSPFTSAVPMSFIHQGPFPSSLRCLCLLNSVCSQKSSLNPLPTSATVLF